MEPHRGVFFLYQENMASNRDLNGRFFFSIEKTTIFIELTKFASAMPKNKVILYIHGMGGGGDSRIPSILKEHFDKTGECETVVRTYSFDPETAAGQIASWVEELKPSLIVGESLGSLNAIKIKGLPHILVSPSLNAPLYFGYLAFLALIPGVTWLLDTIYKPKAGDRQRLHFTFRTMRKYRSLRREALRNSPKAGGKDSFFAFFGTRDHYRRSGIVSIRTYRKHFGNSYSIYDGTHFMEEEYVRSMLIPRITETLSEI